MTVYFYNSNQYMPLKTKLFLIFGIIIGLTLLILFAFTFFIVALVGGLCLFIFNFFRPKKSQFFNNQNSYNTRFYKKPSDNDVIDI